MSKNNEIKAHHKTNGNDLSRINQIEFLINAFKMERIIYIILTSISAVSLMAIGIYLIIDKNDTRSFLALLAPTGTLTLCIFRVLKMWDDALKFIANSKMNDYENQ